MTRLKYRPVIQRLMAYSRFFWCKLYHRHRLQGPWNSAVDRRCTMAIQGSAARMSVGSKCLISEGSFLYSSGHLSIGNNCFLNSHSRIVCHHQIQIGSYCMMGPYSSILDQDHVVDFVDGKSQRHLFDTQPVFIGDHVWLGEKAIVLKGVSIGSYSVIGAGAVVTKSIPEWSIAVGCPARVVRQVSNRSSTSI